MLNLKEINKETIDEYNLYEYCNNRLAIKFTDLVVIGIDEKKDFVYVQVDHGKIRWEEIKEASSYNYSIVGVLDHMIDGLYELMNDDMDHIEQLINDETVFIFKLRRW